MMPDKPERSGEESWASPIQDGIVAGGVDPLRRPGHSQTLLLIDPKPLRRTWTAQWIRSTTRDFDILEVSTAGEIWDDGKRCPPVALTLLNIGAIHPSDPWIRGEIERARSIAPDVPIVIIADGDRETDARDALRLGVDGYVPTTLNGPVVAAALRLVMAGGQFIPPVAFAPSMSPSRAPNGRPNSHDETTRGGQDLTRREADVLHLMQRGLANKVIAHHLSISESTVKAHVHRIMRKLNATNRTEAALRSYRLSAHDGSGPGSH